MMLGQLLALFCTEIKNTQRLERFHTHILIFLITFKMVKRKRQKQKEPHDNSQSSFQILL